jgi:4-hydroxy-tetrahydrodipicolinate reductase
MTTTIVLGDGPLGRAIELALRGRDETVRVLGRPAGGRHDPTILGAADVIVDASRADAVADNMEASLEAGCRTFVIATSGWQVDADRVGAALRRAGGVAVAAPNLALGAAIFLRLVDEVARLAAAIGGFEPSVVEWHRRSKADRPSGTAREIVRRLATRLPIDVDEVAVVRSGSMPGMHAVGLDGASETIELRLTARDRSGYAAGALAAIDWLRATPRSAGIHSFDEVVDERIAVAGLLGGDHPHDYPSEPVGATA